MPTARFDTRLDAILRGLEQLANADKGHTLFGATEHRYAVRPIAAEREVESFELRHNVKLPEDYRAFLTRIGNGGAGPFYGIFPLGEDDKGPWEADGLVGKVGRGFPHTTPWNWPEERLQQLEDDDDGELESEYFQPIDGAVLITHEGCNYRDWLVVSGPEVGNMWHDATTGHGGYRPWGSGSAAREAGCMTWSPKMIGVHARWADITQNPTTMRLSFLDWYELWLAHALATLSHGS